MAAIAAGVVVLLLLVATRYGWHRDELYFLACGRHLAWGYVDQPPFVAVVARAADVLAPGNLVVLRLLPALATAVTIGAGSVIAGELGGGRAGRIAGAAVVAAGGFVLGAGHLLSTAVFDLTAWMVLLAITARLLRTSDPRWWVAFGGVAGLSLLNKNLVVLLCACLAAGLVVERRWRLLASPWLAAGLLVAVAIALPNLLWQARHGWPQADMARALAARLATENRVTLLPLQVLFAGPAFVLIGWRGVRWLAADERARPFRPLLWAWPVGLVAVAVTGGRPYYVIPLTTTIVLAGIAPTIERNGPRSLLPFVIPNALISAVLALPLLPASMASVSATVNEAVAETIGWPELAHQVDSVVRSLPTDQRATAVVLTGSYGEAGALDRVRTQLGLPRVYSPHNSYADFGRPQDDSATVVAVRFTPAYLQQYFADCRPAGTVRNDKDIHNEVAGTPITVCRGLRRPWPDTWRAMRFLA